MAPSIVEEIPGQRRTNLTPSWIYSSVFSCLCSALLALVVESYYYLCSRMLPEIYIAALSQGSASQA